MLGIIRQPFQLYGSEGISGNILAEVAAIALIAQKISRFWEVVTRKCGERPNIFIYICNIYVHIYYVSQYFRDLITIFKELNELINDLYHLSVHH